MAKYELTKEATEDLYRIWDYTVDTWSEQQADKYYSQLIASFRMIAEKPTETGKSYDVIYPGLKGERVGKHIVFFIPRNEKPHSSFVFFMKGWTLNVVCKGKAIPHLLEEPDTPQQACEGGIKVR